MKYILLVFALVTLAGTGIMQPDEFGEPWPMVDRCVVSQAWDAANRANRSFEGAIIMASRLNRLHAFRDDWDTPRIIADLPFTTGPSAISPNAQWYAVVESLGTSNSEGWVTVVESRAIHVYDTLDGTLHSIPWEDRYGANSYPSRLFWIGNEQIVHSLRSSGLEVWYIIGPFSGEISEWDRPFDPTARIFYLSHDGQKGFAADWSPQQWSILDGSDELTFSGRSYVAAWHPSSELLATLNYQEAETNRSTSVFVLDLKGEIQHHIYQHLNDDNNPEFAIQLDAWSPDGRYLAFRHQTLMIADLETHQVRDTCMTVDSLAWSSDGEQLAVNTTTDGNSLLRVIDISTFDSRIIGIPSGPIIGWRADEEG